MVDLYPILKNKVKDLAGALVNLPNSNVWIHEKAIYNLIGIKGGNFHGKREVLTFLLKGIQRGTFGNKQKKDYIPLGYSIPGISIDSEDNQSDICYQQYGDTEVFVSGTHGNKGIHSKPRWFRKGNTITDVTTQIKIVNALTGEAKGLAADVATRRREHYKCFVAGDDDDGGYRRHDVSDIIDKYEEIWSEIAGAKSNTRMGAQRKYNLEDRERIEDVLRLMIVASDNCGKLEVKDGRIVPNNSLRRGRGDGLDARTLKPTAVTPAAAKTNTATKITPKAITFTPLVKEARGGRLSSRNSNNGALLLQDIKCTNADGDVSMKKVSELASLEILFHLFGTHLHLQDRNGAAAAAERDMKRLNVNLPETFDYNNLQLMSSQQVNKSKCNIKKARVFGMMMSNSRLCEQMHGSLRHGLRSGTGMDFVDGQKDYEVSTGYKFRQERREMVAVDERPTKRRKVGLRHNHTKDQLMKVGEQLTEYLPQWLQEAEALLAEAAHGIPTVTQIEKRGRRAKDKYTFNIQFAQEKDRAAKLTREKLSVEKVKEIAAQTNPSNDRILRLGDERLESRRRICEITRKKYWSDEFAVDGRRPNFKVIWLSAVKSFPKLPFILHRGQLRQEGATIRNKTSALKFIGNYLEAVKKTTKLICEFAHGGRSNSSCDRFVPMRDRHFEQADLLEWMGFVKVVDISDSSTEVAESVALACLSSFQKIEEHYTYTLPKSDVPMLLSIAHGDQEDGEEVVDADADDDADGEANNEATSSGENGGQGDGWRRSSRQRRRRNVRHLYPGEESSSDEEEEDDAEEDDALVPFT